LAAFFEIGPLGTDELARTVGRGVRSAVGSYGFMQGGLIVEAGKLPGEVLSPLVESCAVPCGWRIVLFRPRDGMGLAGQPEREAFARLPPVPAEVTDQLEREAYERMLPALKRRDIQSFGESVFQFGRSAGACFQAVQGGPYASSGLSALVGAVRKAGVCGAGQSSWGPTVFAFVPSEDAAGELSLRIARLFSGADELVIETARPNEGGATIALRQTQTVRAH
jgi:beta-RFAP synthase